MPSPRRCTEWQPTSRGPAYTVRQPERSGGVADSAIRPPSAISSRGSIAAHAGRDGFDDVGSDETGVVAGGVAAMTAALMVPLSRAGSRQVRRPQPCSSGCRGRDRRRGRGVGGRHGDPHPVWLAYVSRSALLMRSTKRSPTDSAADAKSGTRRAHDPGFPLTGVGGAYARRERLSGANDFRSTTPTTVPADPRGRRLVSPRSSRSQSAQARHALSRCSTAIEHAF